MAKNLTALTAASVVAMTQGVVLLVIAALMGVIAGRLAAYSALLAGVISLIANTYFACRVFRFRGASQARRIVRAFYVGEIIKLGIIVVLMLVAMIYLKISILPFLLTYVLLQMALWLVPLR
jgi:ATP synthase protein I